MDARHFLFASGLMAPRYAHAENHAPFAALPVQHISGTMPRDRLAVHVSGRFTVDQPPLICVPGYNRNMTDYTDFVRHYRSMASVDWPIVLVDLPGRGRSSFRGSADAYSAVSDAHSLATIARALGISRAIFVGQGHGGQAIMALGAQYAALIAGTVLINSGPTTNPRGLIRLRSNLQYIAQIRGKAQADAAMRQILATDYPGLSDAALDRIAARTHLVDKKGIPRGLFDPALLQFLEQFQHDDDFVPQWHLFDALGPVPLMLIRSELTDRLSRETFEQMCLRRPDAATHRITGEGSPALLDNEDDVGAIADFVAQVGATRI